MAMQYSCTWWTIPEYQKHTALYPTLDMAKKAMAQVICDTVKPQPYLRKLRNEKNTDAARAADLIQQYLADLQLPACKNELELPDHCELRWDDETLFWGYMRHACPTLESRYQAENDCWPVDYEPELYITAFLYESPKLRNKCYGVETQIRPVFCGTNAYPLMVAMALDRGAESAGQIVDYIKTKYNADIDPKTANRHRYMLESLGQPDARYGTSAYPFLVWNTLEEIPQTHEQLAAKIRERYGVKIERKAVGRHLRLLKDMNFGVKRCKEGTYK